MLYIQKTLLDFEPLGTCNCFNSLEMPLYTITVFKMLYCYFLVQALYSRTKVKWISIGLPFIAYHLLYTITVGLVAIGIIYPPLNLKPVKWKRRGERERERVCVCVCHCLCVCVWTNIPDTTLSSLTYLVLTTSSGCIMLISTKPTINNGRVLQEK